MGGHTRRPAAGYQLLTVGLSTAMVAALLGSMTSFWRMEFSSLSILLISLAASAVGWLAWRLPWLALAAAIASVPGIALWQRYDEPLRQKLILLRVQGLEFYSQISQYQWDASFGMDLGHLFVWGVAAAFAILIVREALRRGSSFWSLVAGIALFGIQWAWYFDRASSYFAFYLMGGFVLWAAAASAKRDAAWAASGRKVGYRSHFYSAAAWVLAASIVAATFPINWSPLDLGRFADRIQDVFPALRHMRGTAGQGAGGRFNLRLSGFSSSTLELGGRITLDDTVVFNLITKEPLPGTAYLRGSTSTTYTGRGWGVSAANPVPYPASGSLPTSYGPSVPRLYLSYRIEPLVPVGASVFNVLEPSRIEGLSDLRLDDDGNIWADRVLTRTRPYSVDTRWILYNAQQIRELTVEAPDSEWAPYLQLSNTTTERVRELAQRIASAGTTPLDKAIAIETYLRRIPYALNVPYTPAGRDFVDHFLFDLQRGYCVYYATAMVVMLRQVGIPARWVQGFAVPADGELAEKDGEIVYPVRNSLAHAWVEAYFPGYGWVTFEPTPRTDLPVIGRDVVIPEEETPLFLGGAGDLLPDDMLLAEDGLGDPSGSAGGTPAAPARRPQPRWPLPVLTILGGTGLAWWAVQRRLRKQDELRSTEPGEVVQESWEKATGLLSRFGFGRSPRQTAMEYAQELGGALPPLQGPARRVAEDYSAARYGPPDPSGRPEAAERARDFWEKADEVLFDQFGWARYLWRRLTWWQKR